MGGRSTTLRGLSLSYPLARRERLTVFEGLDLDVEPGEFLSLIGPSGCGKTTLLHLLIGLLDADGGAIEARRDEMALVFQRPRLLPWRRVVDNALFGLECRGPVGEKERERARALLIRVGLEQHLDAYPHQLSEGMKQRVNLARALLVQPRLLLLDEPFAALDVMTRRALQDDLLELWSEHELTCVFVSHSLEEVVYLSDRVAILGDKPRGVVALERVELSRPRGVDAAGKLALVEEVQRLEQRFEAARG